MILLLDPAGDMFKVYCAEDDEGKGIRHDDILTKDLLNKTIAFYLLPSLTSSPEALMGVEWLTAGMAATYEWATQDAMEVCFLRTDEYLIHGDSLLIHMVDNGKLVCPTEEAEGMLGMFCPCDSRVPSQKWTYWSHQGISLGFEYGQFLEFREYINGGGREYNGGSRLESILQNLGCSC